MWLPNYFDRNFGVLVLYLIAAIVAFIVIVKCTVSPLRAHRHSLTVPTDQEALSMPKDYTDRG